MTGEILNSIFEITDGDITVNLLELNPIGFSDAIPGWKGGGSWQSSPFQDGEVLSSRAFGSVVDSIVFNPAFPDQNQLIAKLRILVSLLEKSVSFGATEWQTKPVWIKLRGACEANPIYALIRAWSSPQLDDPLFAPFANGAVEGFTITFSHDIWQSEPPQTGTCLLTSGEQEWLDTGGAVSFTQEDTAHNVVGYNISGQSDISTSNAPHMNIGYFNLIRYGLGLRFHLIIPRNSFVYNSTLTVVSSSALAGTDVAIYINAERGVPPVTPTRSALYYNSTMAARPKLAPNVPWIINAAWAAGLPYASPNLSALIQAIIDQPEWEGEGDIVLYLEEAFSTYAVPDVYRQIEVAAVGHTAPVLAVEFNPNDDTFGQEATCDDSVIFSNKHNQAQLTHAWHYDDSIAAYTDILTGGNVFILPAIPAIGDIIYFVIQASWHDSGPFSNVVLDIRTPSILPYTFAYEYWNGAGGGAWAAVGASLVDGTSGLSLAGVRLIAWNPPGAVNWMSPTGVVNGVTGYCFRMRITAVPAAMTVPQIWNRRPYTCCWPYMDIAEGAVGGDVSALLMTEINWRFRSGAGAADEARIPFHLASRSVSRGADFTPYINLCDEQNPIGATVSVGALTALVNESGALPSMGAVCGRYALFSPAGIVGMAERVKVDFSYNLAAQYTGRFKVFLRYQTSGAATDFTFLLYGKFGTALAGWITDPVLSAAGTTGESLLGYVTLGADLVEGEILRDCYLSVYAACNSGAGPTLAFMDLVLLPVDEYCIYVGHGDASAIPTGTHIKIDGLGNRKIGTRVFSYDVTPPAAGVSRARAFFMPGTWRINNGAHQRIWFHGGVGMLYTSPFGTLSGRNEMNQRYLINRGDST